MQALSQLSQSTAGSLPSLSSSWRQGASLRAVNIDAIETWEFYGRTITYLPSQKTRPATGRASSSANESRSREWRRGSPPIPWFPFPTPLGSGPGASDGAMRSAPEDLHGVQHRNQAGMPGDGRGDISGITSRSGAGGARRQRMRLEQCVPPLARGRFPQRSCRTWRT